MATMAVHLPVGSVTLTRVVNGWRVCRVVPDIENASGYTYDEYVYQDDDTARLSGCGTADPGTLVSLREAVRELTSDYLQSKHQGGLVIDILPARTYEDAQRG